MLTTTEEGESVLLVRATVQDRIAQLLFYQCHFHVTVFAEFVRKFVESKKMLDFHNFARANTCHMSEGIFGEVMHSHQMEKYKVQSVGNLGMLLSSGHKLLRSLKNGLKRECPSALSSLRKRVNKLEDEFRAARNAYEHLDEGINRGDVTDVMDFSFSIHDKLNFKDGKGNSHEMDISHEHCQEIIELWREFISTLRRLRNDSI